MLKINEKNKKLKQYTFFEKDFNQLQTSSPQIVFEFYDNIFTDQWFEKWIEELGIENKLLWLSNRYFEVLKSYHFYLPPTNCNLI